MIFNILETVTLVAGLVYVFLQVRQSIWMWPVDILCCAAAIVVFCHQQLWASMSLNIYYLVMGCIGIAAWRQDAAKAESGTIRLRHMTLRSGLLSLAGFVGAAAVLYYVLTLTGDSSPVLDTFIGASGVVGTVWLVKSYLQNWYVWIVSDLISTILCLTQGLYLMALLYLVYTVVAVIGLRAWHRDGRYIA